MKGKKMVALMAAGIVALSGNVLGTGGDVEIVEASQIMPRYNAIAYTVMDLHETEIDKQLYVESSMSTYIGYTGQITMELQKRPKNSSYNWETIGTWESERKKITLITDYVMGENDYEYRLSVEFISYDSDGNIVDYILDYSSITRL